MGSGLRSERIRKKMRLDTELAGARVYLRNHRPDDLDFSAGMWLDEENGRYLSDPDRGHVDAPFQRALDTLQDSGLGYYLTACLNGTGERVGTCCVFPDQSREEYDIGYCVHKSRWGQGFGREIVELAADWARAQGGKRMTAEVADGNLPSRKLLEACGFRIERASEFEKYHMDVRFKSHIYRLDLEPGRKAVSVALGKRTAETAAVFFEKTNSEAIRKFLPMKAQTAEEAAEDFYASQRPDAASFGRTIWAEGRHVGDVWCYCIDPEAAPNAMVSYCIFERALWGRGAASKALGLFLAEIVPKFGLKTVGAFTYADNRPSVRVLEKNGFRLAEEFMEGGRASQYFECHTESVII